MAKAKRANWKGRCAEMEEVLEVCSRAFDLVPVTQLEKGYTWHPSDDALQLIGKAKDAIYRYSSRHFHGS